MKKAFLRRPVRIMMLLLVLISVATLLLIGAGWGSSATSGSSSGSATSSELRTVEIAVERIACRLCAARITDTVQSLPGVRDIHVSVADGAV